jgi:hypothetical protein
MVVPVRPAFARYRPTTMIQRAVRGLFLLAALLQLGAVPATASAAPSWGGPVTLGPTGRESAPPEIVVTADGEAIAVWEGGRPGGIEVSSRRPGKGWTPAVSVGTGGNPHLVATTGKAVVVWLGGVRVDGGKAEAILASTRLRGGRWSRPVDISAEKQWASEPEVEPPCVGINRRGKVIAFWAGSDEGHLAEYRYKSATQSARSRKWAAPVAVQYSIAGEAAQVGVTPAGGAVAIWGATYDEEAAIEWSSRPPDGRWTLPRGLASPGEFPEPRLAITSKGEAIAAWEDLKGFEGPGDGLRVAARRPGSRRWRSRALAPHEDAHHPTIVTRPGGRATVAWVRTAASGAREVVTSTHSPGAGWTAPVSLAAEGLRLPDEAYPEIAVSDRGEAIAAWASGGERGQRTIIQASSRPRGGSWRAPTNISGSPPAPMFGTADLKVAVAPGGEAFAIWRSYDGRGWVIRTASRPPAGTDSADPRGT